MSTSGTKMRGVPSLSSLLSMKREVWSISPQLLSRKEAYKNHISNVEPQTTCLKPNGMNMSLSVCSQGQPESPFVLPPAPFFVLNLVLENKKPSASKIIIVLNILEVTIQIHGMHW